MTDLRLVAAEWVLPVATPPIEHGAVLVEGDRIAAVSDFESLREAHPEARIHDFLGCVLLPGLVNAHTHLSLTALAGVAPPGEFTSWLDDLVPRIRELDPSTAAASAAAGARRCLGAGITVAGDVTYRDESADVASEIGLAGVFFREVLGMAGEDVADRLSETGFPPQTDGVRTLAGLSAHAPYSTGPGAIQETVRIAREAGLPYLMHVAESPAEDVLLRYGEGRLASLAGRLAPDFEPPSVGTASYLEDLGVLDGMIAVHAVQADDAEIALLADRARGIVLCPRSNAYLECGQAPVRSYIEADARIALGTDSLASNKNFDLFEEARALLEIDPDLSPDRLLRIMTSEGAWVLGLSETLGTLEPDKQADITALAIGPTDDPVRDVVGAGRARHVMAVMSAGIWRVGPE